MTNTILVGSLNQYIDTVKNSPYLSQTDEYALALSYIQHNDLDAAKQLITSHMRYVVMLAYDYKGYGLDIGDLIQEGTIGLMKAVRKFDPSRGFRLATYAVHYIKGAITEYILKNWRIVRVATTKAHHKLFFNLRKSKTEFRWLNSQEVKDIATALNVKESEVREMEGRMYGRDIQIEAPVDTDGDTIGSSPIDYLQMESDDTPDQVYEREQVDVRLDIASQAISALSERERDIVMSRNFAEKRVTLDELSVKYGVSIERVRQIERRALDKLKETMTLMA